MPDPQSLILWTRRSHPNARTDRDSAQRIAAEAEAGVVDSGGSVDTEDRFAVVGKTELITSFTTY